MQITETQEEPRKEGVVRLPPRAERREGPRERARA
jgi:hypothetical protein